MKLIFNNTRLQISNFACKSLHRFFLITHTLGENCETHAGKAKRENICVMANHIIVAVWNQGVKILRFIYTVMTIYLAFIPPLLAQHFTQAFAFLLVSLPAGCVLVTVNDVREWPGSFDVEQTQLLVPQGALFERDLTVWTLMVEREAFLWAIPCRLSFDFDSLSFHFDSHAFWTYDRAGFEIDPLPFDFTRRKLRVQPSLRSGGVDTFSDCTPLQIQTALTMLELRIEIDVGFKTRWSQLRFWPREAFFFLSLYSQTSPPSKTVGFPAVLFEAI